MKVFGKIVLFISGMVAVSFFSWGAYTEGTTFGSFPPVFIGIPAGIIAAILFLVINHFFIRIEGKRKKLLFQFLIAMLLLMLVNLVMYRGGDVIFYLKRL